MMSLYAQCMRERYGYQVIEQDYGFLTYKIDGSICTAIEIFVTHDSRGQGFWQMLWQELLGACLLQGARTILGFVDLRLPDPDTRLKAYMRTGARLKETADRIIVLEWTVPDGS